MSDKVEMAEAVKVSDLFVKKMMSLRYRIMVITCTFSKEINHEQEFPVYVIHFISNIYKAAKVFKIFRQEYPF